MKTSFRHTIYADFHEEEIIGKVLAKSGRTPLSNIVMEAIKMYHEKISNGDNGVSCLPDHKAFEKVLHSCPDNVLDDLLRKSKQLHNLADVVSKYRKARSKIC